MRRVADRRVRSQQRAKGGRCARAEDALAFDAAAALARRIAAVALTCRRPSDLRVRLLLTRMAIFHLSVKPVSRAKGQSATAAAAYRMACRIRDERTGEVHDYTRKRGVLHRELVVPEGAPGWSQDRERLWNAAESAETRKNSTVAREFEVALPAELTPVDRARLAVDLARAIAARHCCAVDVAVHRPGRGGDTRNYHAHLLCSTRRLAAKGFAEKTRELDDFKSGEVGYWRERWAALTNERLRARGSPERVDHRSLEAQGIDRVPTVHKGPALTAIERRGIRTHVPERLERERAEQIQARIERAAELGRVSREQAEVSQSILLLSTDVSAARRERDRASEGRAARGPERAGPADTALERWREAARSARDLARAQRAEPEQGREERSQDREGPDRER